MFELFSVSAVLLLLVVFLTVSAEAQTASITGTVSDSTGAVIPGAKVSAQNETTNASRTTMSDGSGTYRITNLAPGMYGVVIEKPGFKAMEYSRVELSVDQVQNLDATLANLRSIYLTGKARRRHLRRPANPIRHEATVLRILIQVQRSCAAITTSAKRLRR